MAKDRFLFELADVKFEIHAGELRLRCGSTQLYFEPEDVDKIIEGLSKILSIETVRTVKFKDE